MQSACNPLQCYSHTRPRHKGSGCCSFLSSFTAMMFPCAFVSVRVQFSSVERVNYYSTRLLKEEPDAAPAANALATAVPEEWPTRGELRVRTVGHWHGLIARFRPDTVAPPPLQPG